eukprot:5296739-Prymnesium_polylepis.1
MPVEGVPIPVKLLRVFIAFFEVCLVTALLRGGMIDARERRGFGWIAWKESRGSDYRTAEVEPRRICRVVEGGTAPQGGTVTATLGEQTTPKAYTHVALPLGHVR